MRLIAMELFGLILCGLQLAGTGAQRCVTAGAAQSNRDAVQRLTMNGRIFSYESGCRTPLDSTAVRIHLGCVNSESFEAEPFAGWKTDADGKFEVTVPFNRDQAAGVVRVEICLEPKRSCQPVTVDIPGVSESVAAATASKSVSVVTSSKPVVVHGSVKNSLWTTGSVSVCLGGKGKRRRAATGWDDRDMSWLKRGPQRQKTPSVAVEGGGGGGVKKGWSNGIPWLKRVDGGKRLWEGADEEVGWIKRQHKQQTPAEGKGEITGGTNESVDAEDTHQGPQPPKTLRNRPRPLVDGRQLPVVRQRSAWKTMTWPQQEEMKKYWAESDMSWL